MHTPHINGGNNMASTIHLSPEAEQRIDFLVSKTGRTKTFFLGEIIKRGLEDVEDYYLAADLLEGVRKDTEAV
jgi:RHH-type rel operon transcriptional repressor/antitoxin RelB